MFTNIPNNYSSMWGEIIFEYASTTDSDIVINIYDTQTSDQLGVKKFYSTSSAKINIAPLLFDSIFPSPQLSNTNLVNNPSVGFARIKLEAGGEASDQLTFTYAKEQVTPPAVLSTMPKERMLYSGENDQIVVIAPAGTTISYALHLYPIGSEVSSNPIYGICSTDGGVRLFTIHADQYNGLYGAAKIVFSCDGEEFGTIDYTLSAESSTGYRVAWLSSQGSIEQYTFPIIVSKLRQSSDVVTKSLRSAYGTEDEIEALSELVSSAKVWHADSSGGTYTAIEVLTTEQYIRREGVLMIANIEIQEND